MERLAAVVLSCALLGCSLMTVQKPPPRPWATRPECTAHTPAVRNDFLLAAGAALVGLSLIVVGAATAEENPDPGPFESERPMTAPMKVGAVVLIGGTAGFGGSGGYGFNHTRSCRKAQAAFDGGAR